MKRTTVCHRWKRTGLSLLLATLLVSLLAGALLLLLPAQGCSVLEDTSIIKHFIKIHTVFEKFKANILNIIFAHDVEGKTS